VVELAMTVSVDVVAGNYQLAALRREITRIGRDDPIIC